MDRSFLSDAAVVAASRKFVCIRMATYESESEAKILKSIFIGRSGELENTVFAILSPDGERMLVESGRSPKRVFGGTGADAMANMARSMNRIAERYSASAAATGKSASLPYLADTRLAFNVAACDKLPLIVTLGKDDKTRRAIEKKLLPVAWSEPFAGHFLYASASEKSQLKGVEGITIDSGIVVVDPEAYGRGGKPLAQMPAGVGGDELIQQLAKAARLHVPVSRTTTEHVRDGRRDGVNWRTLLPVTDPGRSGGRRAGNRDGGRGSSRGSSRGSGRDGGRGSSRGSSRESGRESGRDGRRGSSRSDTLLGILDTDGDGELSATELSGAAAALKKLDRDGDGKLSREEVRGPSRRSAESRPPR